MLPLKLEIENFYCHSKSIIDFNDFSSAVIVGKINGNEKFSNGSGKSTIFAAIKYVLFNEVDTSSLEKVIKHDKDFCRVSFEFISSTDNQTYKIVRFRGRKPGAEVRFFKLNNGNWEDLTQRTSTETDKEIVKLIKINYKTFSNSVLFAQGDMSGISAMTPKERKSVLKEALQLGIYSKYEAAVKKKISDLVRDIEKNKTIISTLGNPETDLVIFIKSLQDASFIKEKLNKDLTIIDNNISTLNEKIITKSRYLQDLDGQINNITAGLAEVNKNISTLNIDVSKYQFKINDLRNQKEKSFNKAKLLSIELKNLKIINVRNELRDEIEVVRNTLTEQQLELNQLLAKYNDLNIPLTVDAVCKHCRQPVNQEARSICQASIDVEIKEISTKIDKLRKSIQSFKEQKSNLEIEQNKANTLLSSIKEKEYELEKDKKNIISLSSLLEEFVELKKSKDDELRNKESVKDNLIKNQENLILNEAKNKLIVEVSDFKKELHLLLQERQVANDKLYASSNEEAVLLHKIKQRGEDKDKLSLLKRELSQLEYQFTLHQKVLAAFGPNGIPALITHTVLDDYQVESNNILDRLRPGLRLQFLIENERGDGEMADTLEITYFLNNTELEFSQLSGAQKLLVSLALRLGLAAIISKRLGVDLKMILIDEADQSLDEAALETFEHAIKDLQNDYKILIISHNQDFKMKFSHAIVVEQDQLLNSTAKVSNGW